MSPLGERPDALTLERGLRAVLEGRLAAVLDRRPNPAASTFASEIVTCALADGREVRVLCKYGAPFPAAGGHSGGVAYEATVHREALARLRGAAPRLFGAHRDADGSTWLVVEYLDDAMPISKRGEAGLVDAARHIGRLHRRAAPLIGDLPSINVYDAGHYALFARRAESRGVERGWAPAWFGDLVRAFERAVGELTEPPLTLIHGECYPDNVLAWGTVIRPVDWECAAIAAGEVDVAALTERWPAETAAACAAAYREECGRAADHHFERRLGLARIYLHLRSLGGGPRRSPGWRVSDLRDTADRLGLL